MPETTTTGWLDDRDQQEVEQARVQLARANSTMDPVLYLMLSDLVELLMHVAFCGDDDPGPGMPRLVEDEEEDEDEPWRRTA